MVKSGTAILGALAAGVVLAATVTAGAHYRHGNCCGPIHPVYSHSTVNEVSHETHYRDVTHKHYVHRQKLYVHTTRYHPIIYVHNVTRIHDQTVAVVHPVHVSRSEYIPATRYYSSSVIHINEGCVCCVK